MLPLSQGSSVGKTIVIVDDSVELTQMYQEALEFEGFHVFLAESGSKGLELLGRIPPPDLLLVDFLMPGMNGAEFLRELENRSQDVFKNVPIIGLSGLYRECGMLEEMKPLVSRIVEKPNTIDDVIKLAKEAIR